MYCKGELSRNVVSPTFSYGFPRFSEGFLRFSVPAKTNRQLKEPSEAKPPKKVASLKQKTSNVPHHFETSKTINPLSRLQYQGNIKIKIISPVFFFLCWRFLVPNDNRHYKTQTEKKTNTSLAKQKNNSKPQ